MQSYTFSFIGVGNMGGALARAAVKKLPPEQVFLSNRTFEKAEALAAELGCAAGPADRAARDGKFIFLGVKPQMMADLLAEIGPVLAERTDRFLLVTMAAGLTMARIAALAGGEYPVIRIMPNTPCAVGAGVVLCDANRQVTAQELEDFSAALAGAAGALYGLNYSSLAASKFDFNTSILVLVYVVLGGLGNIWGSVIAAAVLYILPEALRQFSDYRMLVYAIVLILVMLATNNPTIKTFLGWKSKGKEAA